MNRPGWVDDWRDWLAPPHCLLCGLPSREGHCPACRASLPWNRPACPGCAQPVGSGGLCPRCQRRRPPFEAAWVPLRLASPVREAVHALKYHGRLDQAEALAGTLVSAFDGQPRPDLLIPVPLHAGRLRSRGYNQALLLGLALARRLALPLAREAARRLHATPDQIGQRAAERRRNLRGAFVVERDLSGLRVALIDDVMTTGATLEALARAAKAAGAREVLAWACARTP
ncbi:MAG TPA: ComF family protein [Nevskiaceae bacterium]|nr:ComF family protein [Nevskiaceae bacterium]